MTKVPGILQSWHDCLVEAAAAYAFLDDAGRAGACASQADTLRVRARRYGVHLASRALPHFSAKSAGADGRRIYVGLNTARQDINAACIAAPNSDSLMLSDLQNLIGELDEITRSAYHNLQVAMYRREVYTVVPDDYISTLGPAYPVGAEGTFACHLVLRLYRAKVPGDYARQLIDWGTVQHQGKAFPDKIVSLYRNGITSEFASAML